MGFLKGRGWLRTEARVAWEVETVARMRRVGDHPDWEVAVKAFNLVLARMAGELDADAKDRPPPHPTVATSIRQILAPLENGAGDAGLGKVFASREDAQVALTAWLDDGEWSCRCPPNPGGLTDPSRNDPRMLSCSLCGATKPETQPT